MCGWHGPSRLFWFLVGAGSATWWFKCHDSNYGWHGYCSRHRISMSDRGDGSATYNSSSQSSWHPREIPRVINNIPPADTGELTPSERERMTEMSRQAGDKLMELSENTLDTVLTTVEVLKAKLAEHRAERLREAEEERRRNQS